VQDAIRKDQRLGVQAVAKEVNLDRESVRWILTEELNMRKVCAKMLPKLLSDEQKELCKELCASLFPKLV
jgi:orotate phosphoribosyltransferase-like protein